MGAVNQGVAEPDLNRPRQEGFIWMNSPKVARPAFLDPEPGIC